MIKNTEEKPKKWKRLFYSLLFINIAAFLVITTLLLWPVSNSTTTEKTNYETLTSSEFTVRTTKSNLNDLVNAYVDKFLHHTNHQYSVLLEEDVHLLGELPIFSTTVPLSIHLEPLVQENGDVILKQKSISIGLLQLPNKKIMEYIKQYLPMPDWVIVNPKDEEIYVAVTDMEIRSNFRVSVEHFDLEANNLAFKFNVPYETLGIEIMHDVENEE